MIGFNVGEAVVDRKIKYMKAQINVFLYFSAKEIIQNIISSSKSISLLR